MIKNKTAIQNKSHNKYVNINIYLLIFIFYFSPFILLSQTPTLYGPPGSRTIDLYVNEKDPSIIFTSNYQGGLFKSSDYGNSVEAVEVYNKDFRINGIFHSVLNNKTFLYAGGNFLVNENNTNEWKLLYDDDKYYPRTKHIMINSFNENVLYMPRYGKEIWRSDDCGDSWFLLHTFENDIDRIAIAPSDSSILYAVAFGLYKSIDSGKNWHKIFENYNFGNYAWQLKVNPQNPHSVYLHGGGNLYKAIGEYDNVDTTIIYNLSDYIIDPKDTLTIYAAASDPWFNTGGEIIKTTDGGGKWVSIHNGLPLNGTTVRKLAIDPVNTSILYAGTSHHGIYKTTDSGEYWELTNLLFDGFIYNYKLVDAVKKEILFVSYAHNLIKTMDGGKKWFYPQLSPHENEWSVYPNSVDFNPNNSKTGYLGNGFDLYKTSDGGTKWIKTDNLEECYIIQFHKYNPDIVYALTNNYNAHISKDGGNTWTILPEFLIPTHFSSNDVNTGYAITAVGDYELMFYIRKTTDFGESWAYYDEGLKTHPESKRVLNITSLGVVSGDPDILYCSQEASIPKSGALNKSEDGGKTWRQIDSALVKLDKHLNITSIAIDQNQTNRIFVGLKGQNQPFTENFSNGGLFLTEDDCKTWRKLFDSYADNIKIDYSTSPKIIYFTTKFGLMSLPDTAHITDVVQNTPVLPKEFVLSQNYPNPFNPSTTINYTIPTPPQPSPYQGEGVLEELVSLVVYDILGREITTLVNENQKPGNYQIEWNAENISSGIYFYRIQSSSFIDVKKMILLR